MSAKLVIHAEITTSAELFEVIALFLEKSTNNPFELERVRAYFTGMGKGLTPEQIDQPTNSTEEKEQSHG